MMGNLFFHNDMDGVISAILIYKIIGDNFKTVKSVDYHLKDWQDEILPKKSVVVDFQFNPTANIWFDHHDSGLGDFKETEFQKLADRDECFYVLDMKAPSCAELIYKSFPSSQYTDFENEMVKWASIFDTASYKSPEQAILAKEEPIKIHNALYVFPEHENVVKKYMQKPFESWSDFGLEKFYDEAEKIKRKSYDDFVKVAEINNKILFADLTESKSPYFKLFPYYFESSIKGAVQIFSKEHGVTISVAKNPFDKNKDKKFNIGKFLEVFGGGGHPDVGGCQFETKAEAIELSKAIIEILQERL